MTGFVLNPGQEQGVTAQDNKPVRVVAGAGTGKTEVVSRRFIHLLRQHLDWRPEHILVLTFSEKAATEMRARILDATVFDRICASLPAVAPWTDLSRAEPVSKVFAMGNLRSVWRDWVVDGRPLLLDFFATGDATMRTNPLYGRGCATGIIQAHILADVLRATDDPIARAKFFASRVREELRPFYDAMVKQDAAWRLRAERAHAPGSRMNVRARLMKSFAEDALIPAARGSLKVARRLARPFHMLEGPNEWLRTPDTMARLIATWATPRALKADCYPGRLGPNRHELRTLAGLPESA